jgi:hypothetical protein
VRQSAAEALARLDPPPPARDGSSPAPAIQATLLTLLAGDDAAMVRRAAALALGRWGNASVDSALVAIQDDEAEDRRVREAAALALRRPRRQTPALHPNQVDSAGGDPKAADDQPPIDMT